MPKPAAMRRACDAVYAALMALAACAMVAAFAAVMLSVADRQFALGLRGLDAYAGYAIAAALFLALPGTLRSGEHIRVTLVLQRLPPRWRTGAEWWCLGAAALLALMLAAYAGKLVWVSWLTHDVSPMSDATPLWLPQIGMALGCAGLALAFVDALVEQMSTGAAYTAAAPAGAAHVE